jgi:hypothetical protein
MMTNAPQKPSSKAARNIIFTFAGVIILIVLSTIIIAVVTLSRPVKTPAPEHPTSAAIALAKKYLGAIAHGDAAAAHAIDKDSYGSATDGIDNTTFTTGAALGHATERIHNLKYSLGGNEQDDSWVETSYTLAGKTYKSELQFTWDDQSKQWALKTDVATLVNVYGYTDATDSSPLPFTLGGVAAAKLPAGVPAPAISNGLYFDSLVYPAVYPLVVTIDPSTLANPATPTTTTLVVPPDPYKGGTAKFLLAAPRS